MMPVEDDVTFRKPSILLLCDQHGWAFDVCAQQLAKHLAYRFDFDIRYVADEPHICQDDYDLIYVFWWGERYHRRFVSAQNKIVKEISSHRWECEERYGMHTPQQAINRYLHDAGSLMVTSRRLYNQFRSNHSSIYHYSLGVDTDVFRILRERTGEMTVGWAGNINDPLKNVNEILLPACTNIVEPLLACGEIPHVAMPEFYNRLDIFCLPSVAEGTPLPLLEAMASGCFPISADVGVVPELIDHGVNGLIVEPTREAFRDAILWCRDHVELVRAGGMRNAEIIRRERSWEKSAQQFGTAIDDILAKLARNLTVDVRDRHHSVQVKRSVTSGPELTFIGYRKAMDSLLREFDAYLPKNLNARILAAGDGLEEILRYLLAHCYDRIVGVSSEPEKIESIRPELAHRVERLELTDEFNFMVRNGETFDCIVIIQSNSCPGLSEFKLLLTAGHRALAQNGLFMLGISATQIRELQSANYEKYGKKLQSPFRFIRKLCLEAGFSKPHFSRYLELRYAFRRAYTELADCWNRSTHQMDSKNNDGTMVWTFQGK